MKKRKNQKNLDDLELNNQDESFKENLPSEDSFYFIENSLEVNPIDSTVKYTSFAKDASKKLLKNKMAMFGLIVFLILALCAFIFPLLPNYDPYTIDSNNLYLSPDSNHWFGTDSQGRDFWSRIWGGLRYSLLLALFTTLINIFIATAIGLSSGYFEKFDKYFQYVIKVLYAFPTIIVLILFSVIFTPTFGVIVLSLIITGWVAPSQQIRAITLKHKNLDFVVASQTLGTKRFSILKTFFRYGFPTILMQITIVFPRMILSEATLGFLGLSTPDIPTLGNLISDGRSGFLNYPLYLMVPLIILIVITISIQLFAFGVEDALGSRSEK